ncbi:hypothetical protein HWE04_04870 [Herbaspirillum sp. C7C2]|nr:hypothetical protein [Herbaspirillum sp. C7C2]
MVWLAWRKIGNPAHGRTLPDDDTHHGDRTLACPACFPRSALLFLQQLRDAPEPETAVYRLSHACSH